MLWCRQNIRYVICKGNVHMRSNAIRAFYKQSEIKIIMLSLVSTGFVAYSSPSVALRAACLTAWRSQENSASGSNLTQATHVVLMDPLAGTKEEQEAAEMQAIGRAQ